MTTNQIKALLKSNGINTKLLSVSQSRGDINVYLFSYELDQTKIEQILAPLNTCRNISHDDDSIWIGTDVRVTYMRAKPTEEMVSYIKNRCQNHNGFTVNNFNAVSQMAAWIDMDKKFPVLNRYQISDLIHQVMA